MSKTKKTSEQDDVDVEFTPSKALEDRFDSTPQDETSESGDALTGPNQKRVDAAAPTIDGSFTPPQTVEEKTGTVVQHAHDTGSNLDAAARLADERALGLPEPNAPHGPLPADEVEKANRAAIRQAHKDVGKDASALERENAERDVLANADDRGIQKGDAAIYTDDDGEEHEAFINELHGDRCSLIVPALNPPRQFGVPMAPDDAKKADRKATFRLDPKRPSLKEKGNVQSFYGTPAERAHPFQKTADDAR